MSRRKANTTINLALRFLAVQDLHGKTPASAVAGADAETCVELISDLKWDHKYC